MDSNQILLYCIGSAVCAGVIVFVASFFLLKRSQNSLLQTQRETLQREFDHQQLQLHQQQSFISSQLSESREQILALNTEIQQLRHQQLQGQQQLGQLQQQAQLVPQFQQEVREARASLDDANARAADLRTQLEAQAAGFEKEQQAWQEKVALLQAAEQRLQEQFENLANKIFDKKQESFAQNSKAGLDALLNPLKEQIEGFKKQVTDQYVREGQERASLKTEIMGLKELNQKITEEAAALTKALKGDNKQQGNWGELVLERVLQESGLREGHEYETQVSLKNDSGKTYQPDVIVHLPNEKDVVVDSKVSLAAYERYYNAQDDEAGRDAYLSEHVNSLRTHIKELGKKDYQQLQGIRTLDYILMFVPIEPAFLLAVEKAPDLIKLALDNNIMLVSPTNLLVALRTINNIWQYEYQNQNAQKIAANAAKLYDKFHGFVSDMEKIGKSLESVQKNYEGAFSKLSSGRGNLIRQVESFRTLGVQSAKKLDKQLLEQALDLDEEIID